MLRPRTPHAQMPGVVCLVAALAVLPACAARQTPFGSAKLDPTVEQQIAKTRVLAARATPRSDAMAATVESWDPRLSAALTALAAVPSADGHRAVAAEYRRLGILDMAHTHLSKAIQLDPSDAAAHDGLARIWRDWGFPNLGFENARTAVQLAPDSPAAANTMGTLYAGVNRLSDALTWYSKALSLDPSAPYALNNYCYAAVRIGRRDAVPACEKAAAAQPASTAVHNNLALAYAASGDLERAAKAFERAGDAEAKYNLGIVHLALRRYDQAVAAFQAALTLRPVFPEAAARMKQSRALASRGVS